MESDRTIVGRAAITASLRQTVIQAVLIVAGCLSVMLCAISPASAQDSVAGDDLQPLPEQVSAQFVQMLGEIEIQKEDIERIEARLVDLTGTPAEIMGARRDRLWASMFHKTLELARDVALQENDGRDVSAYREHLVRELSDLPRSAGFGYHLSDLEFMSSA